MASLRERQRDAVEEEIPFGPPSLPEKEAPAAQRFNQISGKFGAQPIDMLKSTPWRILSNAERMMFSRIEIEYATHGGRDNGRLPVTFDQFVEYGITRKNIAPARRALVALGLITFEHGVAAEKEGERRPNLFGLTYRRVEGAEPTNDWRKIGDDIAEAERIASEARNSRDDGSPRRRRQGPPVLNLIRGGRAA